jgi:hypothetical protein
VAPRLSALPAEPFGNKNQVGNEVLAVNMPPVAIERAQERGFVVEKLSPSSQFRSAVVRLIAPPGMNAMEARGILQAELPTARFAPNRIYRVYKPARQGSPQPAERTAAARYGAGAACDAERCAGRQTVQWKEHLQVCTQGLRVGIIDTDFDHQHTALAARRLKSGSFIPDGRKPAPNWHGTGVVSLLAGDPRSGTPGLIPNSDFYVANVFFEDETGDFATDTFSILKALDWMSAFDVKLINMSFAGPRDELVQNAIAEMSAKGVVFVAAAGNEGPAAPPSYPAAYRQVVAVTAVTRDMRSYAYANRGEHIDVAAPGVDIWAAVPGGREGYHSGTSFAAPYVTAILAASISGAPRRTKAELMSTLEVVDLGTAGRDPIYGRGLLLAPSSCNPASAVASTREERSLPLERASATGWAPIAVQPASPGRSSLGFR